jgi:glyoxylase-like metal-dependent hydrolase (beta-lactamase superfamily II)
MHRRHPRNAPGNWFVDSACSNCTAARSVAPGLIVERDGQSVFARQPETPEEVTMAWRARLLCPTASVRTETEVERPRSIFPEKMTENVYRLGYNSPHSAGAHSFAIRRRGGNCMVDGPRWTKAVVNQFESWGGLSHILLTHRDDVGDAARYARHFASRVWIHDADRHAAPFATDIVEGLDVRAIGDDLSIIPVPGHSKGSVVYYFDGSAFFTGDSLAWDFEGGDLMVWEDYAWYSIREQGRAMRRLLDYPFEWVFAGHGGSQHRPAPEMHARLESLLARMAKP